MEGDARAGRVAEALVREYLSRNRLGATLRSFDAERERTAESITNKNVLRKTLGLDRFALKVKKRTPGMEQTPPSLDLLVAQQLERQSASAEVGRRRSPKQLLSGGPPCLCRTPGGSEERDGPNHRPPRHNVLHNFAEAPASI